MEKNSYPNHLRVRTKNTGIRYWKARMKPFLNPLFWGSLAILSLAAYAIVEYWQHPELLESTSDELTPANTSLDTSIQPEISSDSLAENKNFQKVQLSIDEEKREDLRPLTLEQSNNQTKNSNQQTPTNHFQKIKEQQKKTTSSSNNPLLKSDRSVSTLQQQDRLLERATLSGSNSLLKGRENSSNQSEQPSSIGQLYYQHNREISKDQNDNNLESSNNSFNQTQLNSNQIDSPKYTIPAYSNLPQTNNTLAEKNLNNPYSTQSKITSNSVNYLGQSQQQTSYLNNYSNDRQQLTPNNFNPSYPIGSENYYPQVNHVNDNWSKNNLVSPQSRSNVIIQPQINNTLLNPYSLSGKNGQSNPYSY